MSRLNISIFTSYLQVFIAFIILIICINNDYVLANGMYDKTSSDNNNDKLIYSINQDGSDLKKSIPENIELTRRGVWSRLFRPENSQPRIDSHSPTISDYTFKTVRVQFIPYDKSTIPIELQKALYAHGIVGRRR